MKTYDLLECAELLKVDRNTVLKIAGTGELPGAKIGRAWVFLEDDVLSFLRKKIQEQSNARLQGAFEPEADEKLAKAIVRQFNTHDRRRPGRRARVLPTLPEIPSVAVA
ncbi:helix-turn-helix domain-containing protein [Caballeronia sp. dw_276]|uniref:helix-turn-helix domain-containing protein n=1 Tax=Caballeronia sp. dw_276 TaxID=2719795 RepID=UPI001BD4F300|nr:helix-turn-helix domain-containing protein [Caballeronia sp. dw_276]